MSDSVDNRAPRSASFLQRWSRRKHHHSKHAGDMDRAEDPGTTASAAQAGPPPELPDVEALNENSEVGMFLSEHVSEAIKRRALRKLFHMDKFNVCDGLDDYAEDYTIFQPLGNIVTAHQRLRPGYEAVNEGVDEGPAPAHEPAMEQPDTYMAESENVPPQDEEDIEQDARTKQQEG